MLQPGRSFRTIPYPYLFNGKRMENVELFTTNIYDYGMRSYDARIGRFYSVDPLTRKYPFYSPYQFAGNNPIKYIDLDGLEPENNPKAPGAKETRAMIETSLIQSGTAKSNAEYNIFSSGWWQYSDLKGTYYCRVCGTYITDTKGDPDNKFNMKVYNGAILYVDESQAKDFNNYEAFVTFRLMTNFVTGKGAENYNFPTNGIISSKFLKSDILKSALADFKNKKNVNAVQYSFGEEELKSDILRTGTIFSSITGLVGSGTITIQKTDDDMVKITIFNITSLTSGDILKSPSNTNTWPKSYVRDPNRRTPFGNISQTYNLLLPPNSRLLK